MEHLPEEYSCTDKGNMYYFKKGIIAARWYNGTIQLLKNMTFNYEYAYNILLVTWRSETYEDYINAKYQKNTSEYL